MQIDAYLGSQAVVGRLRRALEQNTLPHALLLTAPDGCGRGFLARCIAADLLYPGGGAGAEAVLAQRSPEFLVVQGEGKSGNIPVDSVRRVRAEVYHSALSASGRAVWIKDAHRMAAPAANALLKVLEEPPKGVVFLLTARDASALPLTVQSRCAVYPLAPPAPAECERLLAERLPQDAEAHWPATLSALYGGRIGKGLKALETPWRLAAAANALEAAQAAARGDGYGWMRIFAGYEGRADGDNERREALLEDMADALEASLLKNGGGRLPALPVVRASKLLPALQEARVALRGNAAPKLTFTALALRMEAICAAPA